MKEIFKLFVSLVNFPVIFYVSSKAFVSIWSWHIVTAFGMPQISQWTAIGIFTLFHFAKPHTYNLAHSDDSDDAKFVKAIFIPYLMVGYATLIAWIAK